MKEYIEEVISMRNKIRWFSKLNSRSKARQPNVLLEIFLALLTIGIGILLFMIITKII